jgi:hypothetical protein
MMKRHQRTQKKTRSYGKPSSVDQDTTDFVLNYESTGDERTVFMSLEEASFRRRGRPVHGYEKRGKLLLVNKKHAKLTTS